MDSSNIIINIRKLVRHVNLESKKIQKNYGISIPQLLTLKYLQDKVDFKATHGEISRYLNLNNSTVTGIVNRLALKGLIAKEQDQRDKRVVYAVLTPGAHQIIKDSPQLMHDELSEKLSHLTPEKISQIEQAFQLVIEVMGIQNLEANPMLGSEEEPISSK
ncbi:MarR family winged helix-turn-helix transcriptional regulator [Fulvivirga ligni]|uniref:MarR family winged helix-turn-helix transcriptional regulator n=1 Tax=Fulvivirga ligni TaxID=2904246 RepID=UPI001F36BD3C|nr:MarR family transcriptional regulator [Fulvivirga ligni]UII19224.1 MarR family transcriptional regulator [Fulvivirga ligni]